MVEYLLAHSWQILQLSLSIFFLGLITFIIPILIRLFRLLGIINDMAIMAQNITGIIQTYLWAPAKLFLSIKGGIAPVLQKIISIFSQK